jgi:hypothetical protein
VSIYLPVLLDIAAMAIDAKSQTKLAMPARRICHWCNRWRINTALNGFSRTTALANLKGGTARQMRWSPPMASKGLTTPGNDKAMPFGIVVMGPLSVGNAGGDGGRNQRPQVAGGWRSPRAVLKSIRPHQWVKHSSTNNRSARTSLLRFSGVF